MTLLGRAGVANLIVVNNCAGIYIGILCIFCEYLCTGILGHSKKSMR